MSCPCSGLRWYGSGGGIPNELLKLSSLPLGYPSQTGPSAQGGTSESKETPGDVCNDFFSPPGCVLACVSCDKVDALVAGSWAVCALRLWLGERLPAHGQLAAFDYPSQLKAFQLLYLVKLCRFSSHMHTL